MAEEVGVLGEAFQHLGVNNACSLPVPGTLVGATTSLGRQPELSFFL